MMHAPTGLVPAVASAMLAVTLAASVSLAQGAGAAPVDAAAAKKLYMTRSCIACHGKDGKKAIQDYPELAGQRADYMVAQIEDILSGKRVGGPDGSGNPRAKGMRGALIAPDGQRRITEDEVKAISVWLATLEPLKHAAPATPPTAEQLAAAGKIFTEKCEACHGPAGRAPQEGFPSIAGQKHAYVVAQMKDIKSGARANGQSEAMKPFVDELSDADIEFLAAYIAAQDPTAPK
ncbi:MAG: c-type cytochrome [Pseudomonadota bacterium]